MTEKYITQEQLDSEIVCLNTHINDLRCDLEALRLYNSTMTGVLVGGMGVDRNIMIEALESAVPLCKGTIIHENFSKLVDEAIMAINESTNGLPSVVSDIPCK